MSERTVKHWRQLSTPLRRRSAVAVQFHSLTKTTKLGNDPHEQRRAAFGNRRFVRGDYPLPMHNQFASLCCCCVHPPGSSTSCKPHHSGIYTDNHPLYLNRTIGPSRPVLRAGSQSYFYFVLGREYR